MSAKKRSATVRTPAGIWHMRNARGQKKSKETEDDYRQNDGGVRNLVKSRKEEKEKEHICSPE